MNFGHVLVFGGTGMLAQATSWIVENATNTVVFGRNRQRLDFLKKRIKSHRLQTEQLDYTCTDDLRKAIHQAYDQNGKIDRVVAWIHSTAPDAVNVIREQITKLQQDHPWTLVLIKGSSSNLASIIQQEEEYKDACTLQVVQLGFVIEGTTSRWLTHEEISNGVIEAIKSRKSTTVVGTLEPWEMRP